MDDEWAYLFLHNQQTQNVILPHRFLQDQGCLPGLVIFLDNGNPQVVLTALEVRNPYSCALLLKYSLTHSIMTPFSSLLLLTGSELSGAGPQQPSPDEERGGPPHQCQETHEQVRRW